MLDYALYEVFWIAYSIRYHFGKLVKAQLAVSVLICFHYRLVYDLL